MRLSMPFPKLVIALAACLGAATAGCVFEGGSDGGGPPDNTPPPDTKPAQVTIDADATIDAKPGEGVGVFVEYATGGHWHVFTACDFNTPTNPGYACGFDVFANVLNPGASISNAKGDQLSGKDGVDLQGDGTVHLYTENTIGLNGMTFDTPPGATVELDVYLDGAEDPHFIYWVGDKVLHTGAPTNPIDFVPTEAYTASQSGSK
jgi:hypothetical protein